MLTAGDIEFDGQNVQSCAPGSGLKVPAEHGTHSPPLGPENPALHTHEDLVMLLGGELELSGHTEQGAGPENGLYVPAPHDAHAPPLFPDAPALQWQSVFSSLAAGALESAGHTWHTLEEAFTVGEYRPAKQFVQTPGPDAILNVPAAHPRHSFPFGPVNPGVHVQSVNSSLAADDCVLAGHRLHTLDSAAMTVENWPVSQLTQGAAPRTSLNFPATHIVHVPPFIPVAPRLHVQSMFSSLPSGEFDRSGQLEQTSLPTAPTLVEYVPPAHIEHTASPGSILYFPTPQSAQEPPFGPDDPALQMQSSRASLTGSDAELDWHGWHGFEMAPVTLEY